MNRETIDLIKLYVQQTLSSPQGITGQAYDTLVNLLQVDRNLALELHEVVNSASETVDEGYRIEDEDFVVEL